MNSANYIQNLRDLQFFISQRNHQNYCSQIKLFLAYFGKDSQKHISADEIKDYMLNAKKSIRKCMHSAISIRSPSSSNVNSHITYAKTEKKIPLVIDMEELVIKIDKIENKKHKAIIALTSSVGLRVSEVIKLKLSDINSKLMKLRSVELKVKKTALYH
jgi:site-specific recombinase XerD